MTKQELMTKLNMDEKTFNEVLKSCAYTEVKNFNAVHETVIKSYLKKADKIYEPLPKGSMSYMVATKTELVSDVIENVEVVTVVRKELIELISRAYHKGIEAGKNSIFIADKNKLEQIFEEALSK